MFHGAWFHDQRFDKYDADISDLIIDCFDRDESGQKLYLEQTYISMKNFLFFSVLLPGASKVDQTHKFDDFLDLTQFFHI